MYTNKNIIKPELKKSLINVLSLLHSCLDQKLWQCAHLLKNKNIMYGFVLTRNHLKVKMKASCNRRFFSWKPKIKVWNVIRKLFSYFTNQNKYWLLIPLYAMLCVLQSSLVDLFFQWSFIWGSFSFVKYVN